MPSLKSNLLDSSTDKLEELCTLVDLLHYRAQSQPARQAYIFLQNGETESGSLTYGELDRQARAIATFLQSQVTSGERTLLLYPSGMEFIAAFFGCLYAGVIAVPAYPPRPNRSINRIKSLITDSGAKIALTSTEVTQNLKRCFNLAPELESLNWIATNEIDLRLSKEWTPPKIDKDTIAYLQYTSGSTSSPKGVMISHHNALHNTLDMAQTWEMSSDSIVVSWLPHFHDFGLVFGILEPIYSGCPGILMSPESFIQKPVRWLQAISRYRGTHSGAPNFAYNLCAERQATIKGLDLDLSSWKVAVNGAEPIHYQTVENFVTAFEPYGFTWEAVSPGYGLAEATLKVCSVPPYTPPTVCTVQSTALEQKKVVEVSAQSSEETQKILGCGRPILNSQIVIVDPETLIPCAPDSIGEIWFSGNSVAQGYWQRQEATKETFKARFIEHQGKPFLRTGDLGFLKDGEIFVMGRLKDLIIIRGRNHYPQDIELTVERSHPALRSNSGAAFSLDVNGKEELVIVQEVERTYLRSMNIDEVVGSIRQAITRQHDLQIYAIVLLKTASIPKTSSGKIQRRACRSGFVAGTLNVVGSWTR